LVIKRGLEAYLFTLSLLGPTFSFLYNVVNMNAASLKRLLIQVRDRKLSPDEAVQRLRDLPFEDLGFAKLDHHRALRQGMPEVIFSEGKTPAQVAAIFVRLATHHPDANILATRATEEQYQAVRDAFAGLYEVDTRVRTRSHASRLPQRRALEASLSYRPLARCVTLCRAHQISEKRHGKGVIAVVSAGTSDIPIAEEAVTTAELMGNRVQHLYDVGVAGIHRLFAHKKVLSSARVIIVCAGMEGALPSVIGGLVGVPVIAVPTSVGYGAAFKGLAALLGMLNSCASNVSVVNIDNGFGAAYVASMINRE
jgi:pyridinium-3,5-biscarboxylic acid mononucleotide synthase